ncbi:MAG: glycosyltransferase involved in cell wall biosynthesis [Flavobacteriales bacterium]|jgi:glycosyltransferase involved in cell wall biosynthesis
MSQPTFSILITTKNRLTDLTFTLNKISCLLEETGVNCVVFDDGSVDGTYEYLQQNHSNIQIKRNAVSKGYLYCRNKMLNETKATYAISLDDDAHFVTENPLSSIHKHFEKNGQCGLIALRIFWGLVEPIESLSNAKPERVQGFVGCAHVWRMKAWHAVPDYPIWFVFYGEEDFASYQLFKKNWEVHYLPEVLINHRVDVKSRKKDIDYSLRLRRSLRSGWYLFMMFYPIRAIPHIMSYSLFIQFKQKVFRGDLRALQAITLGLLDLVWNIPQITRNSNRLTPKEFEAFMKLPATKVYW